VNVSPWRDKRTGRRRGSSRWEQAQRLKVFRVHGYTCFFCKLPINPRLVWPHDGSPTVHHLIPQPGYHPDYCRPAHKSCNMAGGSPGIHDPAPRGQRLW
jgi:hypothetical protein